MHVKPPPSVGVSVVLYKTPMSCVAPLFADLERAGATKIFVIDNSPFGFDEAGDQYQSDVVDRIRVGQNLGYGRAHNIGIRRSVGTYKYHLICNPDISIPRDAISLMVQFMEANAEVGLCMPKLVGVDGEMQYCCRRSPLALDYISQIVLPRTWGRRRRETLEMRSCDYRLQMDVQCLSGCFMFFRSEVLRRLGGFDERFFMYFEDFDISVRSQMLARNIYFPTTHVVHERQSAHKKSWRLKLAFAKSAVLYFSKWGWLSTQVPNASPMDHQHESQRQ
jgi:GT2 family glycosyltransferase